TYYLLPLLFQRKVRFWGMAKWQPWVFAGGIALMSMSMTFAGSFGVPRRSADITFPGAPFTLEFPPVVDLLMAGVGIGGLLAATGAFMYIAIAVASVFFGERFDAT